MPSALPARGFTLLEVLVALAIVALGMSAVFLQAGQSTTATVLVRDKVLAGWIAANRFNDLSLQSMPPAVGEMGGEVTYAGRQWRWRTQVSITPAVMLRADVEVALASAPDQILHTVSGFLGPALPPPAGLPWTPIRPSAPSP
jgi:general secretion pathway protein I